MTGGSRGIGAAIARAFAERGDRVAVHCRDAVAAAEVVRDSLNGDEHVVVRADLAVPAEVRAMVDAAAAGLGGLDVLVNNAGIYLEHPVLGTSYEEWQAAWQATLGINLVGAANATWCAVQHMTASGRGTGGSSTSDRAGRSGASRPTRPTGRARPGCTPWPVAGGGARTARDHGGLGRPGYVATDMTAVELATAAGDVIRAQSPFGRVATVEEVAAAVVYLASPEAEWASGAVLDLNGASYLR